MGDRQNSGGAFGIVLTGAVAALAGALAVLLAGGGALLALGAYLTFSTLAFPALAAPPLKRQAAYLRHRVSFRPLAATQR